jgi:hypothetical protein
MLGGGPVLGSRRDLDRRWLCRERCGRALRARFRFAGGEAAVAAGFPGDYLAARAGGAGRCRPADHGRLRAFALRDCAAVLRPEGFGDQVIGGTLGLLPDDRTAPTRISSSRLPPGNPPAFSSSPRSDGLHLPAPPARAGSLGFCWSGIQSAIAEAIGNVAPHRPAHEMQAAPWQRVHGSPAATCRLTPTLAPSGQRVVFIRLQQHACPRHSPVGIVFFQYRDMRGHGGDDH